MTDWILFVHGDSDGVVSGALAYYYYTSRGYSVDVYFTHPAGLLNDLREFWRRGSNVFIADIALSEPHLNDLIRLLGELSREVEVIYIDHHPEPLAIKPSSLPCTVVHDECCSASELVYRYFSERGLERDYSRIALYGAIGDYLDETSWVRENLVNWDKRSIYFEAGVLVQGLEGSRRLYDFKRRILKLLARNELPSSDPELVLRALVQSRRDEELRLEIKSSVEVHGYVAVVPEPNGSLGRAANYARVYGGVPVGLAYEVRGDKLIMSLRSNTVDLNRILRIVAPRVGGTGGGHRFAAGARIPRNRFEEFLLLLNREIEKQASVNY